MDYTNELWKWIPTCEGKYMVSNFGRIRKHFVNNKKPHSSDGIIVEFKPNYHGYLARAIRVVIDGNTIVKQFKIHRLVGILFIPNPNNHPMLNHIDGNKLNNHYTNLEWTTAKANVHHAFDNGLMIGQTKLNHDIVRKIRHEFDTTTIHYNELAENFNVSTTTVILCVKYMSWDRVDPQLKFTYNINKLEGEKLEEWLNIKYNNRPYKPTKLEVILSELDPNLTNEIKYHYVNNTYTINELVETYNIDFNIVKKILSNDLPEVTILKDEEFKKLNNLLISNLGRIIKNGRIISNRNIKYKIANLFVPNPNNYNRVKLINPHIPCIADNLMWYNPKNKNKFDREEIINLYLNSDYSKLDICTKSGIAEKYNISHIMIMDVLKDVIKIKQHLCKTCGENNIERFYEGRKSRCIPCSTHYVKKGPRPYICKTCGETNPNNFVKTCKGECRKCANIKARNKSIKKGPRPYICKTCGETNPNNFYSGSKGMCKPCSNKTRKNSGKNFPKNFLEN